MKQWYTKVCKDLAEVNGMIEYYQLEVESALENFDKRKSTYQESLNISSEYSHRLVQLQDVEAVLRHLDGKEQEITSALYTNMLDNSKKRMGVKEVEKYVDTDASVISIRHLVNSVTLLRGQVVSITKGIETKTFQLHNQTKLKELKYNMVKDGLIAIDDDLRNL